MNTSSLILPLDEIYKNSDQLIDSSWNILTREEAEDIRTVIENLPAHKHLDEIRYALKHSPIVLVEGATGSGKSTQVPKLWLEKWVLTTKNPKIIATQPRVSAATSLARRVSEELIATTGDTRYEVGNRVGYKTGRWTSSSHLSDLSFHTSMYELMRLSGGGRFADLYMLDEIHTDDIWNEFLALKIRNELLKNKQKLKLILSSATMDRDKLLEYFSRVTKDIPTFEIEGRTFPLEKQFAREHQFFEFFDHFQNEKKNMLIFESGKKEIEETIREITARSPKNTKIFAFHSDIPLDEQRAIINYIPQENENVIIVATNAAEESLTVGYLDVVMDKGKFKVSSTNLDGINRLDEKNVALANHNQRAGRAGRTHNGTVVWANNTNLSELEAFKKSEISLTSLEREILMMNMLSIDILEGLAREKDTGEAFLLNTPNDKLVELSYDRLYLHGAIDENGNITELGKDCLRFPLDFFQAKSLNEAIKRWVSRDMIEYVSIMDVGWLLDGKWAWKKFYKQNRNKIFSDLEFQRKRVWEFSAKYGEIDEATLKFLGSEAGFWFDWMEEFKEWDKRLFEVLDPEALASFGINKRALEKIVELKETLYKKMEELGLEIGSSGDRDDVLLSLLSGQLHSIFSYNTDTKTFEWAFRTKTKDTFKVSNTSIIEPESRSKETYYIGEPFIIWGDGYNTEDMAILSNVTPISGELIKAFSDVLSTTSKKFNILENTQKNKAIRKYLSTLPDKESLVSLDITKEKEKKMSSLFEEMQYTPEYAEIFSILSSIENKEYNRQEIRNFFDTLKARRNTLKDIFKENNWIENFLSNLENLEKNNSFIIGGIAHGYNNPKELFLNDPIFSEHNLSTDIISQRERIDTIENILKKWDIIELLNTAEISKIFGRTGLIPALDIIKDINTSLESHMNGDARVRNNAHNRLKKIIQRLEEVEDILRNTSQTLGQSNRNIRKTEQKIQNLIWTLKEFQAINANFEEKVQSIDFESLLFNFNFREKKSKIITKKYLYNVSYGIIFEKSFLGSSIEEQKIYQKIHKHFSSVLSDDEKRELSHIISGLANKWDDITINSEALIRLKEISEIIRGYYNNRKFDEKRLSNEITEQENNRYYQHTYKAVSSLIDSYFKESYAELIRPKIFEFISKLHEANSKNIEKKMQEFILSLDFSNLLDVWSDFEKMDDYNYNIDTLREHFGKTIKELIYQPSMTVWEIEEEIVKLKKMKNSVEEYSNTHI